MFNDTSSTIALLHSRRSGKARDMIAPGPDAVELDAMLRAALRVPDHGKLAPWRFVIVAADQREKLSNLLVDAYLRDNPAAGRSEIEAAQQFAFQAPTLVVALSSPRTDSKIPLWEQELSAGAACMNLLTAAHAMGFVGNWLTGWAAYSDVVRDAFGGAGDRIAGFIFIGMPARALQERPRPDVLQVVTRWAG
jgi:nitroreductase